ncbi:hypothetical protein RB213_012153, partial [Colletotrichum asianum]
HKRRRPGLSLCNCPARVGYNFSWTGLCSYCICKRTQGRRPCDAPPFRASVLLLHLQSFYRRPRKRCLLGELGAFISLGARGASYGAVGSGGRSAIVGRKEGWVERYRIPG